MNITIYHGVCSECKQDKKSSILQYFIFIIESIHYLSWSLHLLQTRQKKFNWTLYYLYNRNTRLLCSVLKTLYMNERRMNIL